MIILHQEEKYHPKHKQLVQDFDKFIHSYPNNDNKTVHHLIPFAQVLNTNKSKVA